MKPNWVKITGKENFPNYNEQILLHLINNKDENDTFCLTGYYSHKGKKYIVDDVQYYLEENTYTISHYKNIVKS